MKFQIDTNLKTIKLEEKALLKDVLDIMKAMFPNDWKEYTIETNTIINWVNYPTIRYVKPWWDLQPYWINGYTYNNLANNIGQTNNISLADLTSKTKKTNFDSYTTSCNSDMSNIINVETN